MDLSVQVQKAFSRLENLSQCDLPSQELTTKLILELNSALHELHATAVELLEQNEEMAVSRQVLEEERHRYQELFDFAPDGYLVTDMEGIILDANTAATNLFMVSRSMLIGKPLAIFIRSEENHLTFRTRLAEMKKGTAEQIEDWELIILSGKQTTFPISITVGKVMTSGAGPMELRWLLRDITKRRQMEEEKEKRAAELVIANKELAVVEQKLAREKLNKSKEERISILESMTDCFFTVDRNLKFTYVNHGALAVFGKSRDQLLDRKITDVFSVNDTALQRYHEVLREKRSVTFEIISEAFGDKWLDISVYPSETGMACYFRDITSRKLAEKTLRQSEEKFSKAFHGGPIMMTLATVEEGRFIDANEAMCSSTGYTYEEIIGRTSKELNFFVDMNKRQERGKMLIEQGRLENAELDFRTKSGEIRNGLSWSQLFYFDGQPCHITGLIDVTEQKCIQQEIARLDRLNLVGQLAAGIAHEVRNPMTTVRGYLQLLGSKHEYEDKKSTFELMISEVDRANAIITEFLSLAQTKTTELKSQNLNDILNNLYPLLEADTFTQNKQISFIPGKIPNLELNGKEISQLILNLTRNGLEAMQEGGSLRIESYVEECKVVLEITDEGCGITQENINKLGTPFFTTKDTGTGLGLASCYKIAESHKAKILIDSSPSGTTFFILFPIKEQVAMRDDE